MKKKIYHYLEPTENSSKKEKLLIIFIVFLILLNSIVVIIETVDWIFSPLRIYFEIFEYFSITVFSIELILRIWTITENHNYSHPLYGRLRYLVSFYCLIDIFAVLPFYLPIVLFVDLRFLRMFRIMRFIRILKLGRYSTSFQILANVWKRKKGELIASSILATIFIIVSACIVYLAENGAQPDKYSNIPESIYWSAITISSVGYGDVYPITFLGKLFTIIIALIGVGMIALPAGIFAAGFVEEHTTKETNNYCPHCGKKL